MSDPEAAASSSSQRKGRNQKRQGASPSISPVPHRDPNLILRSRVVLPVSETPIENGAIADVGTHDELMKKLGIYRRLYELQFASLEMPSAVAESSTT